MSHLPIESSANRVENVNPRLNALDASKVVPSSHDYRSMQDAFKANGLDNYGKSNTANLHPIDMSGWGDVRNGSAKSDISPKTAKAENGGWRGGEQGTEASSLKPVDEATKNAIKSAPYGKDIQRGELVNQNKSGTAKAESGSWKDQTRDSANGGPGSKAPHLTPIGDTKGGGAKEKENGGGNPTLRPIDTNNIGDKNRPIDSYKGDKQALRPIPGQGGGDRFLTPIDMSQPQSQGGRGLERRSEPTSMGKKAGNRADNTTKPEGQKQETKPAEKEPQANPKDQPKEQSPAKPEVQPKTKPKEQSPAKPEVQPETKPKEQSPAKPEAQPETKPDRKVHPIEWWGGEQPQAKPEAHPWENAH